jgi:MFS family permease
MRTIAQFRSFDRPVQLLVVNQFGINVGFYMLIPYLAGYLAGDLGLAVWVVGLVLGVRNFSQQGMFLIGGTLADRLGYKPLIVAGCVLRTAAFGLLGLVDSLPALIAASAATGFAGALFNPAVRAYLAHDAGERRVEAFALFNIFYQAGILLGPLLGLALTGVDFRLTCAVAAGVFAVLSVLQLRALPQRRGGDTSEGPASSVIAQWRSILGNRSFVLFSTAMIGSYVLAFQVYLALPLEVRRLAGSGVVGTMGVAALFAVSGLLTIAGQMRITAWCRNRWGPGRCLVVGLSLMAASFLPPLVTATAAVDGGTLPTAVLLTPLVLSAALLALGTIIVFPFEMDTIVTLSDNRLVATHYGLYNTVCGIGILLGNLLTGTALDLGRATGLPALPWLALTGIGLLCAAGVGGLDRAGRLQQPTAAVVPT